MDIDNGLGLGIVIFFIIIGLCMVILFICNWCKKNEQRQKQNNNEYQEVKN
jgi:uncharacterized membrane protein YuzA (DUF378 family)